MGDTAAMDMAHLPGLEKLTETTTQALVKHRSLWGESDHHSILMSLSEPEDNVYSYEDGNLCLYGGPFLHFIDGEGDATIGGVDISGDLEEDSNFGGFVSARVDFSENTTLGIEYQLTGSVNALAASILFRF